MTHASPQPPVTPRADRQSTPSPADIFIPTARATETAGRANWLKKIGQVIVGLLIVLLMLAGLLLIAGLGSYIYIANQLPPAEELKQRAITFATTEIYDRQGNLLWEIIDPTGGRRTRVTLSQVSPLLQKATIATEDRNFYRNAGVDPTAIARAFYYNASEQRIVSGGSTITQQLVRNAMLSPEERSQETLKRKLREAVLAMEVSRRYAKEDILEIYLNQIYYGNLAYGIEAASQTYFGKHAVDLDLPEAALLAGLPQSPAIYDPYTNFDAAKRRQEVVLDLMVEAGDIQSPEAEAAKQLDLHPRLKPLENTFKAPHFVTYIRQELEKTYGTELLYQAGLRITTAIDPNLQSIAEDEVKRGWRNWPTVKSPTARWSPWMCTPARSWRWWAAMTSTKARPGRSIWPFTRASPVRPSSRSLIWPPWKKERPPLP